MATSAGSNSKNTENNYEKDLDEKDIYYNSGDNSPYRDNPVPVDYYRRTKSDLLKKIRFKTDESGRFASRVEELHSEKKSLMDQVQTLEQHIKNNRVSKIQSTIFFLIILAGVLYTVNYAFKCSRLGETGFINSETALRKHLRSINQADGVFVSCRVEPQSNVSDKNICNNRNFCTVSQPSTEDRYFCCSSGDAEVNSGCRVLAGTVTNGIFRPRSN